MHKITKVIRAVKIVYKESLSKAEEKNLLSQINILKSLVKNGRTFHLNRHILSATKDHPNIIKLYEYFVDDTAIYIVSELLTGGELFDRIADKWYFSEMNSAVIIKQILSAIAYCHQHKIVHR